ncbi:MAG: T9SS type A sorting domain-containing protein [Bacteroidota bacterium]|nr:T9SS type A sorting domain-containing protein [Bacteroidota bacterium]MDP4211329.1 T9SS type A sorting domain-containing protein [Bacteroidota bacterium]MDP4250297.1 T9SS type A sorting domain-containing protein [Bacteroidota bacterium]
MKRIIGFALLLLLAIPAGLFANSIPSSATDTSSSTKSITLRGSLAVFNAAYGRNYFELNWNTIAGNFEHFEIERSLDGQTFEKLGDVKVNDLTEAGQYLFRDHFKSVTARKNDFYYRLKQFEANGNFSYSKVLIARMYNTKSLASLSVTPDPIANDILVNVQLNENSFVVMKVIDPDGHIILKESGNATTGSSTYTLNDSRNLQKGLYTLEVTVNSREKLVMKLMKG